MSGQSAPNDWKTYDEFAAGIATNRRPLSSQLEGQTLALTFEGGGRLGLELLPNARAAWRDGTESGVDACDVVEVAPQVYFMDLTFAGRPLEAETLIVDCVRKRALSIRSIVREPAEAPGEPRVAQRFRSGALGDDVSGEAPHPTRDLIGLTAHYTYSPQHVYEHIYLSSTRYAWQCLRGVQRGHGDVDLATTYKFADGLYVFTFREFIIPVASIFVYNFADMRSTGKFLGVASDGRVVNSPAGAFIRHVSRALYQLNEEPV